MTLKKYAITIFTIMILIVFHGIVILTCVRASGYAHADVFWYGPIGSFVIALYSALLVGFIVCLVMSRSSSISCIPTNKKEVKVREVIYHFLNLVSFLILLSNFFAFFF